MRKQQSGSLPGLLMDRVFMAQDIWASLVSFFLFDPLFSPTVFMLSGIGPAFTYDNEIFQQQKKLFNIQQITIGKTK